MNENELNRTIMRAEEKYEMMKDKIIDLQNENERLKKELNKHFKEGIEQDTRICKTIEYIKTGKTFENEDNRRIIEKMQNDILNILQGSGKR